MQVVKNFDPWRNTPLGEMLNVSQITESPWKPFEEEIELQAGVANNIVIVDGAPGKVIEFMVLHWAVHTPLTAITWQSIVGTLQDAADAPVLPGGVTVATGYLFNIVGSLFMGTNESSFGVHEHWGITPTVALDLEIDISGGAGAEACHISGIYRYVDVSTTTT